MIEIINKEYPKKNIHFALFDFDGTLSLIRSGWEDIMINMMVEIMLNYNFKESRRDIYNVVQNFVYKLTGKQTIYQMIRFCEEIKKRGELPLKPLDYKKIYNSKLDDFIKERKNNLLNNKATPQEYLVSGVENFLKYLNNLGIKCILASGTDLNYVVEEVKLLQIDNYFSEIYGALDDYKKFSKKFLIKEMIAKHKLHSYQFICFGDGYVEIQETKNNQGIAVGVATDEDNIGQVNTLKRKRLIEAGANFIIYDFLNYKKLMNRVFYT